MPEKLPDFIDRDMLRYPPEVNVGDEAIIRCFAQSNKPYLSRSDVEEMSDLGAEGTRQRLASLESRGILLSGPAGRQTTIYWLNHPASKWPVPDDLPHADDAAVDTVVKINSLTTIVLFFTGIMGSLFALEWVSTLPVTDGVFELTVEPELMAFIATLLFITIFYVALQTSLLVENEDVGWPTIRRVYRRITS